MNTRFARILVILGLVMALFVAAIPAQAQSQAQHLANQATVYADYLNLRSGPDTSYGAVAILRDGQQLTMIGRTTSGAWIQVNVNGTNLSGWVSYSYILTGNNDVFTLPVTSGGVVTPVNNTASVTASFLNIRSGAGANTNVVGRLSKGQVVTLIGRDLEGRWLQISTGTYTGWVSGRYLSYSMNVFTLPLNSNTGISDNLPQPIDPNGQTGIVTASFLNVRLGPSTLQPSFTVLRNGAGVALLGRTSNSAWLLVQMADGRTGWVSTSYISTSYPIGSLPVRA